MRLSWSHAVLYARDEAKMVDFYTRVLGFEVTDRGPLVEGTPDVIFMSQDPEEHHQLGMTAIRQGEEPPNTVHHFAFRVEAFEDVREMARKLEPIEGIEITPLSHGNALSIYFNDRGIAKVDLGIARGKRKYDKRETQKKRDWDRQKARLLRDNR